MNLSLFIARRYLFSKKSHNAINIISSISVCGIAIATAAMICVLSIFNGFGGIVENMFSVFDPDLKITAKKGKVFDYHTPEFDKALRTNGIQIISESLEENVLLISESHIPARVKGVSEEFGLMTDMEKLLRDGSFKLTEDVVDYLTLGIGLAATLGVRPGFVDPVEICVPKRNAKAISPLNPAASLTRRYAQTGGVFSLNTPEYDEQMAIIPIRLARELFDYDIEVTSLDIKLEAGVSVGRVKREIQRLLGDSFLVEDRFEQQRESYRMLQIEKWVTFLILAFILLIAVFNVVGSLSMLIVEKHGDIGSLQYMGASDRLISRIFLYEGWLITFTGIFAGIVTGLLLCLLQEHFGLLKLSNIPGAYIIDAYPVIVKATDMITVFATVSLISLLTVLYPVSGLKRKLRQNNGPDIII